MIHQDHKTALIQPITTDTKETYTPLIHRRRMSRGRVFVAILFGVVLLVAGLANLVYTDPALVPDAVELMRGIVGPSLVAEIEEWVFQTEDRVRQIHYQATGARSTVQWAAPATTLQAPRSIPRVSAEASVDPALSRPATGAGMTSGVGPADATPAPDNHTSDSGIWSAFVTTAAGQPVLERALVDPDSNRPYVQAALVRIDLRSTQLHLVAGTDEPRATVRVTRPGTIPTPDQQLGRLLAAFNGGFKAVNGAFGMNVGGVTLLPPKDGLATLTLSRDGSVHIGTWGKDITATPDLSAYRQNCPLLVADGSLTPQALSDNAALWGHTVGNKVATWRSGLGLSADSRYLIYVAGNGLTVPTLAHALITGGAERAMQLDINSFWTRFVTFESNNAGKLEAQKLTDAMAGDQRQFLAPDSRDFFYVTTK